MKPRFPSFLSRFFTYFVPSILVLLVSTQNVFSAEVTLAWDANSEEDLAGYGVFCRQEGESYNYNDPAWEGDKTETSCTIYNLDDHTTYCFVVRALDTSGNESGDSNEVCYEPQASNIAPLMPVITSPYYGQMECELLAHIKTEPFSDPDRDLHSQSRWQISKQEDFSSMILDVTSTEQLTDLTVPHMLLEGDTTYYVRVQFYDAHLEPSGWSETIEFTTASAVNDLDANGVPDEQEVGYDVDLNGDGIADNDQPEVIKCTQTTDGAAIIGVCKVSDSISAIDAVETMDPVTISDNTNRPGNLYFGLISYRIRVKEPGATATVRIYFSEDISQAGTFYKYDTISGWQDYSQHTTFNEDGRNVTLEVKDGYYGDSDRVANGVIVDPGGLGTASSSEAQTSEGATSGRGSGGCFIVTAALGSYMEPHVKLLRDFRDQRLLTNKPGRWFVIMYYRYSPFWTDLINTHSWCKPIVRVALTPIVGLCHITVRTLVEPKFMAALFLFLAFMVILRHPLLFLSFRPKGPPWRDSFSIDVPLLSSRSGPGRNLLADIPCVFPFHIQNTSNRRSCLSPCIL
jgi:hypothetical protein